MKFTKSILLFISMFALLFGVLYPVIDNWKPVEAGYSALYDTTYVYATGGTTWKVYKYYKSNLTKVAESIGTGSTVNFLIQDSTYVYAAATGGLTQQYWKSNMTYRTCSAAYGSGIPRSLAQNATYLYIAGDTNDTIFQCWKSNMTRKKFSSNYGASIKALAADTTYVYDGGGTNLTVKQYWQSNLTLRKFSTTYGGMIHSIIPDGTNTYVYVGGETANKIYCYWISNMTKKSMSLSYGGGIYSLVKDSTYIYAAGLTNTTVKQYWLSNLTEKAHSPKYGGTVNAISQDATYIYAVGATNQTVKQYWKSNMSLKTFSKGYGGDLTALASDDLTFIYVTPTLTVPSPTNGTTKNSLTPKCAITITEPDGITGKLDWWTNETGSWVHHQQNYSGIGNGTYRYTFTGASSNGAKYYWKVAFNDTHNNVSAWYTFTTKDVPNVPSPFTATTINRTKITITWTKGSMADRTYVEAKLGSQPSSITDGTNLYNNTGLTVSQTSLTPGQHWYYSAWSWNNTDSCYSSTYATSDATTASNHLPFYGTPTPANASTSQPLALTWSVLINDSDGDTFTWHIECSNHQTATASGATNGTKSLTISGLAYSTLYYVWVNTSDIYGTTKAVYHFTTKADSAPVFSSESPTNNSINQPYPALVFYIYISDPNGDLFDWSIVCNGYSNANFGASNGTKNVVIMGLSYSTTYTVTVSASDGTLSTVRWYQFTVRDEYIPGAPVGFTAKTINRFQININWTKVAYEDYTYVKAKVGSYPTSRTDGIAGFYNNTGTSSSWNIPTPGTSVYFRAWSFNVTDEAWGSSTAYVSNTTFSNIAPNYGTPSPHNNSISQPLSLTWSILINDSEGDLFTWNISCSNGQYSNHSSATNGTKSLSITGLSYFTPYTIWVNTTDGYNCTRYWYNFYTIANQQVVLSNPFPPDGATGISVYLNNVSVNTTDPEGDLITWDILVSIPHIATSYGNNQINGTKICILPTLKYSTTYFWHIDAVDNNGSHIVSSATYSFTTKADSAPIQFNEVPTNNSISLPVSFTWQLNISDPNGDTLNWTIQCGTQSNGANLATNGTKTIALSLLSYSTIYTVYVNATDGILWTNATYHFTTTSAPISMIPPVLSNEIPHNGTINCSTSFIWTIQINATHAFNFSITCSNGQFTMTNLTNNGTKILSLSSLYHNTTYTVVVRALDTVNGLWTNATYNFTTISATIPVSGGTKSSNFYSYNVISSNFGEGELWFIIIIIIISIILIIYLSRKKNKK